MSYLCIPEALAQGFGLLPIGHMLGPMHGSALMQVAYNLIQAGQADAQTSAKYQSRFGILLEAQENYRWPNRQQVMPGPQDHDQNDMLFLSKLGKIASMLQTFCIILRHVTVATSTWKHMPLLMPHLDRALEYQCMAELLRLQHDGPFVYAVRYAFSEF